MTPLLPGATVGILGGGQLARMMAIEARRMGFVTAVVDAQARSPAGQVSDLQVQAALDDLPALQAFAERCDVLTLDTEHVPSQVLHQLEASSLLRPAARVISTIQDRLHQRRFLSELGIAQPETRGVDDLEALDGAVQRLGLPCVLKARRAGYDGRGQVYVERAEDAEAAWNAIGRVPAVVEAFVDYVAEVSLVLARDVEGNFEYFPLAENQHQDGILRTTIVPARFPSSLQLHAQGIAKRIANALEYVGVLAVELYLTRDSRLLVNEVAPRPHNSGHFTLGASVTSQFEQHVRAVCGLPLGDASLLRPAVMLNLLGDLWAHGQPPWKALLRHPNARLHLYGKVATDPRRKMGHLLVTGETPSLALHTASQISTTLSLEPKGTFHGPL